MQIEFLHIAVLGYISCKLQPRVDHETAVTRQLTPGRVFYWRPRGAVVARWAHNPKVGGANPSAATRYNQAEKGDGCVSTAGDPSPARDLHRARDDVRDGLIPPRLGNLTCHKPHRSHALRQAAASWCGMAATDAVPTSARHGPGRPRPPSAGRGPSCRPRGLPRSRPP